MARFDIKTDTDNDLFINANGDFEITESTLQHQQDIIETNSGEWKEFPLCGIGIQNYLHAERPEQELQKEIGTQLTADGQSVKKVQVQFDSNGALQIAIDAI